MRRTFILLSLFFGLFLSSPLHAQSTAQVSNPDIGVNLLGLYQNSNRGNESHRPAPNGFSLQAVELQFTSDVDPLFRAEALIGMHREREHSESFWHAEEHHEGDEHEEEHEDHAEEEHEGDGEEAHAHAGGFHVAPEEVFIETLALPIVTVKAGKFKTAITRHNTLHTHSYPFVDAPLVHRKLLGPEGLNSTGVSTAALLPLPWYSELTFQAVEDNAPLFASENANEVLGIARLRQLWDLTSSSTLDLGVSGAQGPNEFEEKTTIAAADLTVKWRPTEKGRYSALSWTTEFVQVNKQGLEHEPVRGGVASWLRYQFARRWWVQYRAEKLGLPEPEEEDPTTRQSVLLGFFPSEFSALRLQYDRLRDERDEPEDRLALQMNVSIGAHPAHTY